MRPEFNIYALSKDGSPIFHGRCNMDEVVSLTAQILTAGGEITGIINADED